jgi:hypothetical protein
MAAYNKINQFVQDLANKKHDLSADVFKVMLTNSAPVATNSIKSDLTDISAGNGYTAGGTAATITSSTQTSGTEKVDLGRRGVHRIRRGWPFPVCRALQRHPVHSGQAAHRVVGLRLCRHARQRRHLHMVP